MMIRLIFSFSLALMAALFSPCALAQEAPGKTLCITVDDLPKGGVLGGEEHIYRINVDLLRTLSHYKVKAVGFVNESKCYDDDGEVIASQKQMLQAWVDAGMELGNHAYSHMDINRVSLQEFKEDVLRGDFLSEPLMAAAGGRVRYFRHPYLHRGDTEMKRQGLEQFLREHNYTEAPVTVDNEEWIYNAAYEKALKDGEDSLAASIGEHYVAYMLDMVSYYEQQSQGLFDRMIAQVLLIHVNSLNADYLAPLLKGLQEKGYRFITLEEALQDPAYESADTFTGRAGITWLHRWAITRGVEPSFFAGEPSCPDWVKKRAGILD